MQPIARFSLTGYRHSIYTRIARIALLAKGAAFIEIEVNPFEPPLPPGYPHPFARVPVLAHGGFTLYETSAIARYIDLALPGPPLVPASSMAAARMQQVISIADAYAFRPLVLQVYAQSVFAPQEGLPPDQDQIDVGLLSAPRVLSALEAVAHEGLVLAPGSPNLADCHLAPMIAAFATAEAGAALLARYPALSRWWAAIRHDPSFRASGRDHMAV